MWTGRCNVDSASETLPMLKCFTSKSLVLIMMLSWELFCFHVMNLLLEKVQ
jgi:hypothetical protein